jgi:hypothetical protein
MKLGFLLPPPSSWALRFGRKFVTLESCRSHDLLSHNVSSAVVTLHSWKVGLEYLNMQQFFLKMRVVVRGQGSSCKEHFGPHNPKYWAKRKRERYELKIHAANSIGTINHHPNTIGFCQLFEHNIMLSLLMNLTKCCTTVSSPKKDCKHSLIFYYSRV